MNAEDRKAAKKEHRDAVDAFYRQNGIEPPRRVAETALGRFRQRVDEALTSGRELLPARTRDELKASMSPQDRELLDFADHLAATRDSWSGARARNDAERAKEKLATDDPEAYYKQYGPYRPTERTVAKPTGVTVSHKEDIINTLVVARDHVENQVYAYVANTAQLMEDSKRMLAGVQQQIAQAAGYVSQAHGSESSLNSGLIMLEQERFEAAESTARAASQLEDLRQRAAAIIQAINDAIAREQAIG